MKKLLVCMGLLALFAAPGMAAVNLGLPLETEVNFDGNGVFDQSIPGGFDAQGPLPAPIGAVLFGAGTISGIASTAAPGTPLWRPEDVGPNFGMTFTFWNAVVTSSARNFLDMDGDGSLESLLTATYADGARLLLIEQPNVAFDSTGGPGLFNLATGEYPTAYEIGDEIFLDLSLSGNTSTLIWDPDTSRFIVGTFTSTAVNILGGSGASQFQTFTGADGRASSIILTFNPTGWAFGGDVNIQLTTIPEPATLVFLGTGLVSLLGYGIRRRMA